GAGGGTPPPPPPPAPPPAPGAGRTERFDLAARANGTTYPIEVYLPAVAAGDERLFPTIYVTDADAVYVQGQTRFQNFRSLLTAAGKEAILVGIGNTARRGIDYDLPGAQAYHAFLVEELVPQVESRYAADPAVRMLSGLSLGGSFVVIAMLLEALDGPPQFSHYLSSDGAFHSNYGSAIDALEERVYARRAETGIPATLYLTHGSSAPSNQQAVQNFGLRLRARNYPKLNLITEGFPAGHLGMDPLAFDAALERFL
uniref:alpha/beta hydrolase n=1 Tax=Xenophilus sp. Marseille-Q4582 TaxID=2866600 RepID=UPI001CE3CA7E